MSRCWGTLPKLDGAMSTPPNTAPAVSPLDASAAVSPEAIAARDRLSAILTADDPTELLWVAQEDGFFERWVPEISALAMEQETGRRLFGSSDAAEGVRAFLEKRQAAFGEG